MMAPRRRRAVAVGIAYAIATQTLLCLASRNEVTRERLRMFTISSSPPLEDLRAVPCEVCQSDDGKVVIVDDGTEEEEVQGGIVVIGGAKLKKYLSKLKATFVELPFVPLRHIPTLSDKEREDVVSGNGTSYHTEFRDLATMQRKLEALANQAQDDLQVELVPFGETLQHNALPSIRFGNLKAKRLLWVQCGIHAREWIAPASCMYMLDEFLSNKAQRQWLSHQNIAIQLSPCVNPDGYAFSWEKSYHPDHRYWRKNRRPLDTCTGVDLNCTGVDLNRNFDDGHWQGGGVESSNTYSGTRAFSENETQAIQDEIQELKKKGYEVLAGIDIHSYMQKILRPPGWYAPKKGSPETEVESVNRKLSERMQKAIQDSSGRVYGIATAGSLGAGAGGADDYLSHTTACHIGLTMELSPEQINFNSFFRSAARFLRLRKKETDYAEMMSGFNPPPEMIPKVGSDVLTAMRTILNFLADEATCKAA